MVAMGRNGCMMKQTHETNGGVMKGLLLAIWMVLVGLLYVLVFKENVETVSVTIGLVSFAVALLGAITKAFD